MNRIFFVMGKSASGKDTIYNRLLSDRELKLNRLVGYTTRPMREGEVEGKEYHFVDYETLQEMKRQGRVIECREYHTVYGSWYYFTVDEKTNEGDYILLGTLESYRSIRKYYEQQGVQGKKVVPVYIHVEDGERLLRAITRERQQKEPKYAEMCRRFLADCEDFSEEKIREAKITVRYENKDLEECIKRVKTDILAEGSQNPTSVI